MQAGERLLVIGGGMAAVHAWIGALQAGAVVTALHRRPLRRQPLNAPRCRFGTAGIAAYQSLAPAQRRAFHAARTSSFPWRWHWEWLLWRCRRAGSFVQVLGELAAVEVGDAQHEVPVRLQLLDQRSLRCDRLLCATGFEHNACAHDLIAQLVAMYELPMVDGMLCLTDDLQIPGLSRPGSTCTVVGALARWALPVADTFVGMKYAARRLVTTVSQSVASSS